MTLSYKGYHSTVEYSEADHVYFGKLEGITDLVNYESTTIESVEKEFQSAVDDYIAFCSDMKSDEIKKSMANDLINIFDQAKDTYTAKEVKQMIKSYIAAAT